MENYQIAIIIKDNKVLCLKDKKSLYRPTPWMVPYKKINHSLFKDNNGTSFVKQIKKDANIDISLLTKLNKTNKDKNYDIFVYQYVEGKIIDAYSFFTLDDLYNIDFDSDFSYIYEFIFSLLSKNHYVISKDNKLYSSNYKNSYLIDMFDDVDILFDEDTTLLNAILKTNELISFSSSTKDYSCYRLFKDGKLDNYLFA